MADRYDVTDPYDTGYLDTGDGNQVYYEVYGNPDGKPAVIVHGGPGAGMPKGTKRSFDPQRYRIIQFDQRNCGRSTPHASDPAADMSLNTTEHLLADIERLRAHLGVGRWLMFGGSWGATLALAYAQRHPDHVSELLLVSAMVTSPSAVDWLYRGVGQFFPEAWDRFRQGVPDSERDGDLVMAYSRLMENPDVEVRSRAALDWLRWEDAVISMEVNGTPGAYSNRAGDEQIAFVRICAHIFAHRGWLEEGTLIRDAGKLAGIPGVLIHGRQDMGCPVQRVWELARRWPNARLVVIEDAGHTGNAAFGRELRKALDEFADRP
ncbi:proline iminopeptidase [Streptoalloteichus tenebrarius]|uniref:Proline iminopeptidase n=1 Tax=Streptoalloteichus tenebrarius (strain ATCC 17920 / DSM 40477 / JCM 4838 / CBS 697.72 / NBRC 16177 / NCIMB 11028 / NRRL B-12390 / A12253. 1 / ISP 5477) TaxID=1933 RepID=A0ABT1HUT2_STRSD|nr:prolyl aminopeptidase [Streptoalloteichus tenebrarius]MCP2259276.1 proline iminopeptidase [Streptoalloteichus tenebrarius]BFE99036.1 prolyl aminopeptidase [Streptoalloteichus tenebrarius]